MTAFAAVWIESAFGATVKPEVDVVGVEDGLLVSMLGVEGLIGLAPGIFDLLIFPSIDEE